MHSHNSHCISIIRRTDLRIGLVPVRKELGQGVPVCLAPVQHRVHKRLDIRNLARKSIRAHGLHLPDEILAEVHEGVIFRRRVNAERLNQERIEPVGRVVRI